MRTGCTRRFPSIIRPAQSSLHVIGRTHLQAGVLYLFQIVSIYIMILRRIFRPKSDENGEWIRLHNEELHSLYRSPNIVRVIKSIKLRWAGHVARMEEGRSAFKILTGKSIGKRPLGRPRRRWENNIRVDLEEIGINAGNWVDSAQDRNYWRALVNHCISRFHKPWS